MKSRQLAIFLAAAACVGVLYLGTRALQQAFAPWTAMSEFLRNPLALHTRVLPGPVVLSQVQQLRRLETCRYQGQVIVRGDRKGLLPVWLAGDRLLFEGHGEVVAGVDLARMRPEDLQVEGRQVSLRLPRTEILYSRLDNRQSQVYERHSGLFTGPTADLEGQVRQQAEDQIRQAALESGVLSTAEANARETLRQHLKPLGFDEVRFL